jgi:dTDP-4-dehydrorhamnose reductase
MKSLLVLGSTGMLGYGVLSSLIKYKNIKIEATIRSVNSLKKIKNKYPYNKVKNFHILDVLKVKKVKIDQLVNQYDYIINCIGIIKPEIDTSSSRSIKKTIYINSIFPNILASSLLNNQTKIFQIATDCVFTGKKGNYDEFSNHDDVEIYGISKSMGEIKKNNFFNLRTSIIGREFLTKKSLVEWFLNQKGYANGFENHNWNGVTTKAFGEYLYAIIDKNINIPNLLHVIPKNMVNKYELLKIFKKKFKSKLKINKFKPKFKIDRSLTTVHKNLNNRIWKKTIFKSKPSIEEMVNKL